RQMLHGTEVETRHGDERNGDFRDLPENKRVGFAVAISAEAGDRAEDSPRREEEDRHQGNRLLLAEGLLMQGEKHGGSVDDLVVEARQELSDNKAGKRAMIKRT